MNELLTTDEALITATSQNVSAINAACQKILKQMEQQLLTLLRKNRKEQEVVEAYLSVNGKVTCSDTFKKGNFKCAGMPYFKDPYGFQPPPNEDVIRKQKNNKLLPIDILKSFPVWSSADVKNLVNAIKQYDISNPSSIDWMRISASDMEGKYSPSECKSKWNMHLNPNINRLKWSLKETQLLKELSAKHNCQDWDKIASELGTNRTGLQCCIQYHTHTFPTEGKWTKEEDENLKQVVERFKIKDYIPWTKVVWHFENRSLKQCQERYLYHLGNIKKGNFTMEEDFVITYLASKLKNFAEVAKFLPKRVSTQVRSRYEYLVGLSMPEFTKEEDELLVKLITQHGRNWGKISESFQNRSRIQCRRRWEHLQKNIKIEDEIQSENENEDDEKPALETSQNPQKKSVDAENVRKSISQISKLAHCDRKYSAVYSSLLDHHKYCYKFLFGPRVRIPSDSVEIKKLTAKMSLAMKTLSVSGPLSGFDINTLSNNCEFTKEDFSVLSQLKSNEQETWEFELSRKVIPPNYMTLVGLRTITLGWNNIRNLSNFHSGESQISKEIDPADRLLFSDAKKLFKSRLKACFAFPLILSNISPGEESKPIYKSKRRKVKPLSKRRRKEHAKMMNEAYRSKLKPICDKFPVSEDVCYDELLGSKSSTKSKRKRPALNRAESKSKGSKGDCVETIGKVSRKRTGSFRGDKEECVTPLKKRAPRNVSSLDSEWIQAVDHSVPREKIRVKK